MKILSALILTFVLVINAFTVSAQKDERDANYHFKSQSYFVALTLYQELYESDTLNTTYSYRLGICHLNTNQEPWKALGYLLKVDSLYKDDPQFTFDLGKAYLYNYNMDKAITQFEAARVLEQKDEIFKENVNRWIHMAANAKAMVSKPLDVSFINLGDKLNSEMDDLTPIISPDGELLFYTTNREYDHKVMLYTNNVYYSDVDDGVFEKGRKLSTVSSIDDEYVAGFSLANDKLFVQMAGYEAFQDIMYSERVGDKGFRGKNMLASTVNSKSGEFAASETTNGDTLFFSSNRDGGMGGTDIYYSLKLPTGEWGEPFNCGDQINSPYNEDFPVLADDGSTLYFCSDNEESMGGFDIFKSKINAKTREFSAAKNIGYPLNDVFDNQTIAFSPNQRYAYVSASREGGYGYADIYRVVFNQEDPSVKILIFELKTGTAEAKTDLTTVDTTIQVTAFSKAKVVFGKYAYDFKSKQATIALPPGNYTLEITGKTIEQEELRVTIPDIPVGGKIEKREVLVKEKN